MRLIAFDWTTPALVTGNKTVTRRNRSEWTMEYASRFYAGEVLQAFDVSPRHGGAPVGSIRLTEKPYTQWLRDTPDSDYQAEGLEWLLAHPDVLSKIIDGNPREAWLRTSCTRAGFDRWRQSGGVVWVVRFELAALTEHGDALKEQYASVASR